MSFAAGDTTDPVFTNCPNNIVSYVNGPSATASIDFPTPTAVDNSGVPPVVSGSVGSPHTMGVGSVTASYVARDGSGNEATCTFSISVVGKKLFDNLIIDQRQLDLATA